MRPLGPPFLGDLELAVMNHLWSKGSQDARAVHQAVGRSRRITLSTIQSTLKRLFEKDLLQRDKVSHAHVYDPRISRSEFHQLILQEVVKTVMGGESDAMLAAFIGVAEDVGPKQLEQLEALVAERLRSRKRGRP